LDAAAHAGQIFVHAMLPNRGKAGDARAQSRCHENVTQSCR
jgi:hypothetical protein